MTLVKLLNTTESYTLRLAGISLNISQY